MLARNVIGGNNRARTYDPLLVRQMLSQLSYASIFHRISVSCLATFKIISQEFALVNTFFKFFLKIFIRYFIALFEAQPTPVQPVYYITIFLKLQ